MIDGNTTSLRKAPRYRDRDGHEVRAKQMDGTFRVMTSLGPERGRKGDYLCVEDSGRYPMPQQRFDDRYNLVREEDDVQ